MKSVIHKKKRGGETSSDVIERLLWKLRTDKLTGLLSAEGFLKEAQAELSFANRHKLPVVYLLFDLVGLGDLNNKLGQTRGDLALRVAARAIREIFYRRSDDIVGHPHGDEFDVFFVIGKESVNGHSQKRIVRAGDDFKTLLGYLQGQLENIRSQMNRFWEKVFLEEIGILPGRKLDIRMGKSCFDPSVEKSRPYPSLAELRNWADEDLMSAKRVGKMVPQK